MKKYYLAFLASVFTNVIFSQNNRSDFFENVSPAIITGVNISKLQNDSLDCTAATQPFIFLGLSKPLSSSLGIEFSGGYSLKGSNVLLPYSRYRFQYLDFQAGANYYISPSLSFQAGITPSFVIKSRFIVGTDSTIFLPKTNFYNEWEAFAGLNFRFQGNSGIGLKYFFPLKDASFHNIQLYLSIPLNTGTKKTNEKENTDQSKKQILELKNGVLIVRLKTSENAIKYLIENGKTEEAETMKQQQADMNREIINSFRQRFSFCPVYFFFSSQTDAALKGQFNGILLNEKLEIDTSIKIINPIYYFAEFDYLESDDESSTGTGIEALIVKDMNMKQLSRPFPFFVRKNELMMGTRNIGQVVTLLNYNLQQYYNLCNISVNK